MRKWEELPAFMKNDKVLEYYRILGKKRVSISVKRVLDFLLALILLIILAPVFVVVSVLVKKDSAGPVFFRQIRITTYGRTFWIYKFRTMYVSKEEGAQVTAKDNQRITKLGSRIRKYRLDELPQLINILKGDMSFVGTRPEVQKYVLKYSDEMMATLLMPAGITSKASILFRDEESILENSHDVEKDYIEKVLPEKMKYNLSALKNYSLINDIKIMFMTVWKVMQ